MTPYLVVGCSITLQNLLKLTNLTLQEYTPCLKRKTLTVYNQNGMCGLSDIERVCVEREGMIYT